PVLNAENGFYALGLAALDADSSNISETFIFDNIFADLDAEDVLKDFDDFKYSYDATLNFTEDPTKVLKKEVEWFYTWFYGNYRLIWFAGDKNFKDFVVTYGDVQEEDGNFHEPAFHLEGDGIGVFGSALADTVYFKILKK
ncbi:hypothetical protein IT568_12735, partial [bacterium]|nr:hypothetical protein [bacterium]